MNRKNIFRLVLTLLAVGWVENSLAQGTAFLYQGRLNDNGSPANSTYDLRFAVYDAATNGNQLTFPQTNFATVVSSGLFTATLDFGPIFIGPNYWLSIGVRTNGSTNAFTLLFPRQPLLPVPYAMFATTASNVSGTLQFSQITGALPSAQLVGNYLGAVNFTNAANSFFGKFFGNGLYLTNLNASLIATGTLADVRLSTNVALLNQGQTNGGGNLFTGTNTFTGPNNFTGANTFGNGGNSFFGTFAGNGNALTNLNGTNLTVGTVADARLSTNVALLNQSQIYGGANVFTGTNYFSNGNTFAGTNYFTSANVYGGFNSFTNATNFFNGAFAGNGNALTNLSASLIATGTIADARLSVNVALLNQNQTNTGTNLFTGANNFTNRGNSFVGNFFGNGLVGWIPFSGTSTQAMADAGYMLTSSLFTTITMPSAPIAGDIVRISGAGSGGWRVIGSGAQSFIGNFSSYHNSSFYPAAFSSGNNWVSLASSADGIRMYAVGVGGVYSSTDSGHTFSGPNGFFSGGWTGIATSADGNRVYAVTASKAIYASSDAGVNWLPILSTSASNCTSIACSADGTKVIAAVKNGSVFISANSGGSWAGTGLANGTWNVAYAGNGSSYIIGGANALYISATLSTFTATFTGVAASYDGSKFAACSSAGLIYTNSGAGWGSAPGPFSNLSCLAGSSDLTRLVTGGNGGGIYSSVNFGQNWSLLAGSTNQVWAGLATSADATKLAAGVNTASGGLYYYNAGGQYTGGTTNTSIIGSQGSAVELQYIGNNQFMPISSSGSLWVN